jgi:hypothetical protein
VTTATIHLPEELKQSAEHIAQSRGVTLDEFVCDSLRQSLQQVEDRDQMFNTDPLFADRAVFTGEAPSDLSAEHDYYLYGDGK